MKKITKMSILLSSSLLTITPIKAYEVNGSDNWTVSFDGNNMNSTFKSSEISESMSLLQPGDTANFEVSISNDYSSATDWYMSNEVLKTLEETQSVAEGGAYSYVLTYYDPEGNSFLLYSNDSDQVGGEYIITKDAERLEGLKQATDSLEDYFFLDSLDAGASGKVTLKVHLEGESQGNPYQDTWGRLQMNFAVELDSSSNRRKRKEVPNTGDNTPLLLYSALALIGGIGCISIVIFNVKHRKEDE